jgi:3-dehydroquinate dehydratase
VTGFGIFGYYLALRGVRDMVKDAPKRSAEKK